MVVIKEKIIIDIKSFKEGLLEMPFVLSVTRYNGSFWKIIADESSSNLEKDKISNYIDNFSGQYQYEFFKKVDNTSLKDAILYRTSFSSKYIKHVYNTSLKIIMNQELTESEYEELSDLVELIDNNYDFYVRNNYKNDIIKKKKDFGINFLDDFSAMNHAKGGTVEQVLSLLSKYSSIPILCITGSIESLYAVVSTILPDENISEQEIKEFKKRIELFLSNI